MAITDELQRLGNSAQRLNAGSDQLNRLIERIDELLSQLMIGLDYVHPRPIDETTSADHNGKRVIELSYVGYLRTSRSYHLAIKTVKVLESKLAVATQNPGEVVPLLAAPRRLRYAAVDVLPELVAGLAAQVEEMAGSLERRCQTAESLVRNLEAVAQHGGSLHARPEDSAILRRTLIAEEMAPSSASASASSSAARRVIAPGELSSSEAHGLGGESSGQWVLPHHAGGTAPQPAARDERRTIALGSDVLKGQGGQ
jgi:hypothetical protein